MFGFIGSQTSESDNAGLDGMLIHSYKPQNREKIGDSGIATIISG